MFDGQNKFQVSDPTTAVGGTTIKRMGWTLLSSFCYTYQTGLYFKTLVPPKQNLQLFLS